MVQRIFVCGSDDETLAPTARRRSVINSFTLFVGLTSAIAAAVLKSNTLPSFWFWSAFSTALESPRRWLYFLFSATATTLCGTYSCMKFRARKLSLGYAILLYPTGIQLESVVIQNQSTVPDVVSSKALRFIPRESIMDCVVLEVVLANRVKNALVLRLLVNKSKELVDLLPNVDLTYNECMDLRNMVNTHVKEIFPVKD